jgi:hypothetical protein
MLGVVMEVTKRIASDQRRQPAPRTARSRGAPTVGTGCPSPAAAQVAPSSPAPARPGGGGPVREVIALAASAVGVIQVAFGRDEVQLHGQPHPFLAFEQVVASGGVRARNWWVCSRPCN